MPVSDLRISGAQTFSVRESDIRVDFLNPNRIISASNARDASGAQLQCYSLDGGASWTQTRLPMVTGEIFHTDPTVDWTSDGTAWTMTIGMDSSMHGFLRSYRSHNGGATWFFDATISAGQNKADKPMMWVDHSTSSPFRDTVYAIWTNHSRVYVNHRKWPSAFWQPAKKVSGGETTGQGIGSDIKTNSFGDVFAFWPDTGSRNLYVSKSTNGGASFSTPVTIATTFDSYDIGVPSFSGRRAFIYITGAAYRTANKNIVYAVWTDLTGAAGCNSSANEPNTSTTSSCKTRIWFSRSIDGGATWQTAIMINDQTSLNDQYNPWLAMDETDGFLAVIYYDTVNDSGRLKADVWFQFSADDGVTWSTPRKVTSSMTDESGRGGIQWGDYNGLSGHSGKFFPSWTDRRSGGDEEIWSARIIASSLKKLFIEKEISFPVSIRSVAAGLGLSPPFSIEQLIQKLIS
jgi:hypothetical protein